MTSWSRSYKRGGFKIDDYGSSVRTANFHQIIESGGILPENPYSHYGEQRWVGESIYLLHDPSSVTKVKTSVEPEASPDLELTAATDAFSRLYDAHTNAFLTKIKGLSLGVITMLHERKQTLSLMEKFCGNMLYTAVHWKNPRLVFRRWLGSDVKIRRKFMRKLDRRLLRCSQPSEAWLEYRYAYRPLLCDISDSLKAFEKADKRIRTTTCRRVDTLRGRTVFNDVGLYQALVGTLAWDYRVVSRCKFRVTDPSLNALGNLASVGASIWDIIPWSFVIDWFADISSWLDLQNATLGLQFVSGSCSVKRTFTRTYSPALEPKKGWFYTVTCVSPPQPWVSTYFYRYLYTSVPDPVLICHGASAIDLSRLLDLLSLVRQKYAGRVKSTFHF